MVQRPFVGQDLRDRSVPLRRLQRNIHHMLVRERLTDMRWHAREADIDTSPPRMFFLFISNWGSIGAFSEPTWSKPRFSLQCPPDADHPVKCLPQVTVVPRKSRTCR